MDRKKFESIWKDFSYILDEMKDGVCYFEGYIPNISIQDFKIKLLTLTEEPSKLDFSSTVWSDDSSDSEINKQHEIDDLISLFKNQKIVSLAVNYDKQFANDKLSFRLLFDYWNNRYDLEIICYRENVLQSNNPKEAIYQAVLHFQKLKILFNGPAFFLAETINESPENIEEYPDYWIRIE